MISRKSFLPITLFSSALFLELVVAPSLFVKVQAQSQTASQAQIQGSTVSRVTFDPPGQGKPDDTAGGASRGGGCPQEVIAEGGCVIPVMPNTKEGLTVAERPTFFVYVPETSAKEIFFSLVDDNNNTQYQTKIPITSKGGVVAFKLPDSAPALAVGKNYQWTFIVIGEKGLRPDSPGAQGGIKRIEPNSTLSGELQNKNLVERAGVYAKHGIWYDTLASLAEAKHSQSGSENVVPIWQDLLTSVGLTEIANKPLLN